MSSELFLKGTGWTPVMGPYFPGKELGEEALERVFDIHFESVVQIENNSVGYDWDHFLSIGDKVIKKGDSIKVTIKKRAPLVIDANSVETDAHYSDIGKKSLTLTYSDLISIERQRFQIDVTVIENGGQRAGNLAKWRFLFMVTQN